MREIAIGTKFARRTGIALVDDADFDWLMRYRWTDDGQGYAATAFRIDGKLTFRKMHVALMVPGYIDGGVVPAGVEIDHIDSNRLNNQRSNLRIADQSQQMMNKRLRKDNTSGFKGVYPTAYGKWQAKIVYRQKKAYLGTFEKAEDAARAYDRVARLFFAEFGTYNFPINGERPARRTA